MNDKEREQFVQNDEGLYDWYRSSRMGMTRFIRENRVLIDHVYKKVTSSEKPAHYLKYGG